jgi:UDP-GlcNAc:undecaprenyl-phosphate GlcNAc-1-phosphate transferase
MTQYLPILLASGLLAFLATPLTRILARRLGMIDQPGLRKAHRLPVPLLGGLAVYVALALTFILFGNRDWLAEGLGILGGATLLFLTGLWDDRYGMSARLKLAAQFVAAFGLVAAGVQVNLLGDWWLNTLLTVAWVVSLTNAVNLMDNMDGLAAGISAVAAIFFFVLAASEGQGLVASLAAALFGSALGFLFYNFAPAMSFMGDAGALPLGFLLGVIGIKIKFIHFPLASTWMAPIVVLGVLIFDTSLVVFSRLRRHRPIFQGGSDHTSHRLVQLGISPPRAVLTLYVAATALGALALFLTRAPALTANLVFAVLVVLGFFLLIAFDRIEPKLTGDPPIVLIPGGSGLVEALRSVKAVSRDIVILIAPRQIDNQVYPSRLEMVETISELAEDPDAVRDFLNRGLSEIWWRDVPNLNRVLRLGGFPLVVCDPPLGFLPAPNPTYTLNGEPAPQAVNALHRAKLILLGPGDPEINLIPTLVSPGMREALLAANGERLWVGSETELEKITQWLGTSPVPISLAFLQEELQKRLLKQAAAHSKTQA